MEAILHSLGIDLSTLILQVIGFVLLYLILQKYVFGKVAGVIEDRKQEIRERMEKLEADQKELERLQEAVKQRLAEIELEARSRIQSAVEEANAARERILEQANQAAEQDLAKARATIQREKARAVAELREQVGDIAIRIAERVLNTSLDGSHHQRVINEFIEQLPSSNAN